MEYFPTVLHRLADWFLHRFLPTKLKHLGPLFLTPPSTATKHPAHHHAPYPDITRCRSRKSQTLICDFHGCLLRSRSFFPFFMLVAFEGGGLFRALLLLLTWPVLWLLDNETKMRVMVFVTFCGLRPEHVDGVARSVLPKFYLEDLNRYAFEVFMSAGSRVVVTSVPRVMVEEFLKEYMGVDRVVGTELHRTGRFFTGFVSSSGLVVKHRAAMEIFKEKRADIGIGGPSLDDHLLMSLCKEAYLVTGGPTSPTLPREKYPKPLIFHDGRLAFLPTPSAALAMFLWLPAGLLLAVFRLLIGILLPYRLSLLLGTASGIRIRFSGKAPPGFRTRGRGILYVCSHRTLLDPVFLSTCLGKPLTAVTYSLSRTSEILAPIKTVRLSRDRDRDGPSMQRLLAEGDLVVCPEGTTCREPYLLRFSSLFAELAEEIVPVAVNTSVTMFYGTTASGLKWLDPFFFLMNPRPSYSVEILEMVPRELTCAGGRLSHEVANYIQRRLGKALGFECTNLTRRDKYLMLAGNEGLVEEKRKN